jgi:hypothetical protein
MPRLCLLLAAGFMSALAAQPLQAQTAADSAAIRATALDYIEGWYHGDAQRMANALHPDLVKRIVEAGPTGTNHLDNMTAAELIRATGQNAPKAGGTERKDVRILDVFGNTASVRVDADQWIDYMHVARWDGDWKIVNVLWEMRR